MQIFAEDSFSLPLNHISAEMSKGMQCKILNLHSFHEQRQLIAIRHTARKDLLGEYVCRLIRMWYGDEVISGTMNHVHE